MVNEQLRRGDFFLCASARQRDFWIGQLTAVGRVNEAVYDSSPDLDALIAVVPFGVPDTAPTRTGPGLRGVVPGIADGDEVVYWGGGIYDWFDPPTLVRAVVRLRERHPRLRLVFAGGRHPNPSVGETAMARRARALADELGLTGTHVFFGEWTAYDERANSLLDADIAVSTHLDHVETRYSFRTRILDAFWAGLPVVATAGDALADEVVATGAGIVVVPGDVDAVVGALHRLLDDDAARAAAGAASRELGARVPVVDGAGAAGRPLRLAAAEPRPPDSRDRHGHSSRRRPRRPPGIPGPERTRVRAPGRMGHLAHQGRAEAAPRAVR